MRYGGGRMRQEEILELVRKYPGSTARELAKIYTSDDTVSRERIHWIRSRIFASLKVLEKYRIVERSESRARDEYGRSCIRTTWRATD